MRQTVEKAIRRIAKQTEKETGGNILDFLYDAAERYETDDNGNLATCEWIINGLENEADNYIRLVKEEQAADYSKVCKQIFKDTMPRSKDIRPYSIKNLQELLKSASPEQPIIVEVGGERVPLTHVYIAGENEDDGYDNIHKGCLVLNLDTGI